MIGQRLTRSVSSPTTFAVLHQIVQAVWNNISQKGIVHCMDESVQVCINVQGEYTAY